MHHDGVGYVFPNSGNVELKIDQQTGNWSSLGLKSGSAAMDVFSLWFDHGVNPAGAQYEYRVIPGVDLTAMVTQVKNMSVRTISNTTDLQAVRNDSLKVTGLVFYAAGEVEIRSGLTVRADGPSVVLVKETAEKTTVTVADPTGLDTVVNITLTYAEETSIPMVFTMPTGVESGRSITQTTEFLIPGMSPPLAPANLKIQ
ncbi:MAG: hypothetical protein A2Z20_02860 [Bdellovibrionales bacterium RBG_16_40_8]|nr:MAG: hypothetical protein A2Z20_02860 [Bdellovibrionales bacterium RBG_16_40_8]